MVCAKHGILDIGLAKVCKKLKVHLPEKGYWAKSVFISYGVLSPKQPIRSLLEGYRVHRNPEREKTHHDESFILINSRNLSLPKKTKRSGGTNYSSKRESCAFKNQAWDYGITGQLN
jgi:hypothetical protein